MILFELLALEMPFQASSLPALVHRICTTEPPYTKITNPSTPSNAAAAGNVSAPIITLLKSMLNKKPGKPCLALTCLVLLSLPIKYTHTVILKQLYNHYHSIHGSPLF